MRSPRRGLSRRLTPMVAALVAIGSIGVAAAPPAAADANLNVALTVITPLPGGAVNTVYVGQPVSYQLTVTAGTNGLKGVSFTDSLPADLTYNSVAGTGWTCPVTPAPGTAGPVTCQLTGDMAAGAASTATLNLTMSATTALTAVGFNPTGHATTPTGATGIVWVTAAVAPAADLSLAKTMNPPPAPGQVSYNLVVTNHGPSSVTTALVSSTVPSTLRSDGPYWVGMQVAVGPTPLTVTSLGRWVVAGNSGSHGVKLVVASTGLDVPGGSATVNTLGQPGGAFAYGALAGPATLTANTTYFLVSYETGADQWYDVNTTTVTPTGAASVPGAVYSSTGTPGSWVALGAGYANRSYVPVNLLYDAPITIADTLPAGLSFVSGTGTGWTCAASGQAISCTRTGLAAGASSTVTIVASGVAKVTTGASVSSPVLDPNPANNTAPAPQGTVPFGVTADDPGPCGLAVAGLRTCNLVAAAGTVTTTTPLVGSTALGALRSDGPYWVGMQVAVGTTPLTVTSLGRWVVAGNSGTHGVKLVVASTGVDVPGASATVNTLGQPGGAFAYAPMPGPVTLAANTTYFLVSYETGADQWYDVNGTTVTPTGAASVPGAVYSSTGAPGSWVALGAGYANRSYVPVNLIYTSNLTVPGSGPTIPIWGFAMDPGNGTTPAGTIPGPTLVVKEGETLRLVVRNALPTVPGDDNLLAVQIPGAKTAHPDSTGVASGSTTSATSAGYNWSGLKPGTYVYEAGQTVNGARQIAMGLAGLLIVRPSGFNPAKITLFDPPATPTTGTACTSTNGSSQFTAESLVQVNELSSEFHANPFTSTMSPGGGNGPINTIGHNNPGGSADIATYMPDVFLINGQAYPSTAVTPVNATDCVAVHYANLGMLEKSFGVLGQRQTVMADDSTPLAHPQDLATKYLNPGEHVDAVVDMTGATPGTVFPIMDFGRHLHNGSGSPSSATPAANTGMALGGQLALLQVAGTQPATLNPTVDLVGLDHNTVAVAKSGTVTPAQLNLTARATPRNGGSIAGGQYTIDNIPPLDATTGAPILAAGTINGSLSATGTAAIPTSTLTGLANGDHVIWVRVRDNQGHWSDPPAGVVFTFDAVNQQGGPTIANASIDPNVSNGKTPNKIVGVGSACAGSTPVAGVPDLGCDFVIEGTATPSLSDWSITGFTWSIDTGAGHAVPLTLPGGPGSSVDISTVVPAAQFVNGLSQGGHNLVLLATETQGTNTRDGNPVMVPFTYVTNGPSAVIDSMTPSPAGPASDHSANANYFPSVRIRGTFNDNLAQVVGGEMWFLPVVNGSPVGLTGGKPSPDGQGVAVTPDSGTWTTPAGQPVPFFVDLPSNEFNGLPQGPVAIYVHGKDAAGNWTASWTVKNLIVDKTQPVILDHTTGRTDPAITSPSAGVFNLDLWAQDPATAPPACTVTGGQITPPGCGIPETSNVTAVEWTTGAASNDANLDFTYILGGPGGTSAPAAPTNGPVHIQIDITAAGPYPSGSSANFRVRDGAGNWTDWQTVTVP